MTLSLGGPLLLVGAGKMGGAMLTGWLEKGLPAHQIVARDPAPPDEVAALLNDKGIAHAADAVTGETPPAVIVLAVKPQMMDEVLADVAPLAGPDTLVISVAAGCTVAQLARHFGEEAAIIRVMPNTPSAVGRGMLVAFPNARVTATQRDACQTLMEAVGAVAWISDEGHMDAVTGVSGSGPAYVFYMVECLAAAGVAAGLSEPLAMQLARETVAGAGELLHQSPLDAATLRENVTSPGGTTAEGLSVLMQDDGLEKLMREAVAAAMRRSRELGG